MGDSELFPVRVSTFDELIERGGIERGSTILISGSCGAGKSIFAMQSAYYSALAGEKVYYITFEETPEKIKTHMKTNFGWNISTVEHKKKMVLESADPFKISMAIDTEDEMWRAKGLPFHVDVMDRAIPSKVDRIVIDSLSALSAAFIDKDKYRLYLKILFDSLNRKNSVNFVITESKQDLGLHSEANIAEFLSDGVIVLYNIKKDMIRERALEILKLRCSSHVTETIPFKITYKGIEIFPQERVF